MDERFASLTTDRSIRQVQGANVTYRAVGG